MPQLDKVTFFSQYFWLLVFFLSFYLFVAKYILPKMVRIYLLRQRVLSSNNVAASQTFTSEDSTFPIPASEISTKSLQELANSIYSKAVAIGKKKSNEYATNLPKWATEVSVDIDKKYLSKFYSSFLRSLVISNVSKLISIFNLLSADQQYNKIQVNYISNSKKVAADLKSFLSSKTVQTSDSSAKKGNSKKK